MEKAFLFLLGLVILPLSEQKRNLYQFMKNRTRSLLLTAALLLVGTAGLQAQSDPFTFSNGDSSATGEFSDTSSKLNVVIQFAFYVMYLIGGTMLAASGFKLKAGDMPGFYKMAAGGVVIFLSPFLIGSLLSMSQ